MAKKVTETAENEVTGVCRFCCQTRIIKGGWNMTEEELTERATLSCECEAAVIYRKRMKRAQAAKDSVDTLFGDESSSFYQPYEITDFIKHGIDVINNGGIKALTITMNKGLKCNIAKTTNDEIKVSREAKSIVEFKQ